MGDIYSYIQQVPGGAKFTGKMICDEACCRNLIDDAMKDDIIELAAAGDPGWICPACVPGVR